ncbi:MAG TPA: 50S ribosomal protein L3, partial [Candidatus Altiarchaeales archaeon]|nr:50S ribosomal protein L3 [Candidatus Altiarchaeales archaeon]
MAKTHRPRSGSLAYHPRKRAKRETPRIHNWQESEEVKLLGFAGYKAGMTHVIAFDNNTNNPTSGLEVFIPVTVIETPPMVVACIRAYRDGYFGKEVYTEIWAKDLADDLLKKVSLPKNRSPEKKLKELEKNLDNVSDIRHIMHTQPRLTSMPKKKPDIMEIAIGGTIQEKFEFAKNNLGKEINVEDVFSENKFVDVVAVT